MPGGLQTLLPIEIQNQTNKLATLSNSVLSVVNYSNNLSSDTSAVEGLITGSLNASINDLMDNAPSMNWFQGLANRTVPPSCTTDSKFLQDSLVPSTTNRSLCAAGTAVVDCTDFSTCASGCINMYRVMTNAGNLATFQSQIGNRYGAACAADLSAQLTTVYNNWHIKRTDISNGIGSVSNNWATKSRLDLSWLEANITATRTNLKTVIGNDFITDMSRLLDPTTGMVGVNCTLVADDLQLVKDTVCINLVNALSKEFGVVAAGSNILMLFLGLVVIAFIKCYPPNRVSPSTSNNPPRDSGRPTRPSPINNGIKQPSEDNIL